MKFPFTNIHLLASCILDIRTLKECLSVWKLVFLISIFIYHRVRIHNVYFDEKYIEYEIC